VSAVKVSTDSSQLRQDAPEVQGRIGLLVPSSNTTVEPEFYRALPPGISLHCARLYLTRIDPESIHRTQEELERESRNLASADVDVILLGATAPSFLHGLGYDRELIRRIQQATGKPATTTSTAVLAALEALKVRRIALGSAYDEQVNNIAADFLEANGYQVVSRGCLGLVDNLEVGRLAVETAYETGRQVDSAEAEAVLLACTNWRSLAIVERLEEELGKPVLTTTQASLWAVLRMLGHRGALPGYGSLFLAPP
jgi:maleate isomerase